MKNRVAVIILIVLSLIPLFDLLIPGLPITHDGKDHVARIATFYKKQQINTKQYKWKFQ